MTPTTKNQLQDTNADYVYDAAGNLIQPGPIGGPYVFDAENHLTSAGGLVYLYDGDGKRVGKAPASTPTQPNYLYWYGTGSQILEETDGAGNYAYEDYYFNGMLLARGESDNWVDHFFADALGNTRCVYGDGDPDGGCSDYYPFGGERPIPSCCPTNPGGVNVPFMFTAKERDSESGLDNFGARYNSSNTGRFMSPDPLYIEEQRMLDPQLLNLYSYARNNPLNLTDPSGMLVDVNCQQVTAAQCSQTVTDFNNRDGAQFQVTRDDKTGQLNVVGNVDPTKLSDGERALYNSITNTDATGTVTVVGNDSSFDFEKSTGKGQNSVDRSDLNALNGADTRLSGIVISHAALESYDSAKPGVSVDQAHAYAESFFGVQYNPRFWTPYRDSAGLVAGASNRFYFSRPNVMTRVRTTLKTPIPYVDWSKSTRLPPRDVTSVTIVPAVQ